MGNTRVDDQLKQAARLIELERTQFGNELHDSLLPLLFAASASLSVAIDELDESKNASQREQLGKALAWIDQARSAGRHLLTGIYPPELNNLPWDAAAQDAIDQLFDTPPSAEWTIASELRQASRPVALTLYRITVESVRNAVRHGQAAEVSVSGSVCGDQWVLCVKDNGKGFVPDDVAADRFGIRAMKARAAMVGGSLTVQSHSGGPTVVTLSIPTSTSSSSSDAATTPDGT